ncbi:MAG TPA: hypothetical protein VF881_08020 [Polyangiaceae bacterium]
MRTRIAIVVGCSWIALSSFAHAQAAPPRRDAAKEAPTARPPYGPERVYLNVEGGYTTASLHTLTMNGLSPQMVDSSTDGAGYGIGGGFRLAFFTLGARVRGANLTAGNLTTVNGELGAHIPLQRFDPYFTFGAGYAGLNAGAGTLAQVPDLQIHGYNARAGLGLDYYPDKIFTIGLNVTGDVLGMARPGVDLSTSPRAQAEERARTCDGIPDLAQKQQCFSNAIYDAQGATAGFAGTFALVMGAHF